MGRYMENFVDPYISDGLPDQVVAKMLYSNKYISTAIYKDSCSFISFVYITCLPFNRQV